ncbi:MAG TPA: DUF481 domain-containing protein, partial [Phenylobacterium sp.]|nr:DUF481 domain-containing protein [Phenylobacterium sp.]
MAAALAVGSGWLAFTPGSAQATPPPKAVIDMIDAAAGDPATLKTVVEIAKKTNPDSTAEIDAEVKALAERAEAERVAKLSHQTFFEGWSGKGQAGGFVSTGNSDDRGLTVVLGFTKESLHWRHGFEVLADYQESDGEASKE